MTGMHARTGRAMTRIAHIGQSVIDIITTPVGSRVMRRDYGSDVPELIDQPLNGATVLRLYAATAYAILRWEPRIQLTGVQLERGQQGDATLILDGVADGQGVQMLVPVKQAGAV
ncbi:Phage baseplate assembly protein [Collimonas arenae]|uniref:Phage baseplate assembly protein n=1 Tax=Collimonas arenae TaxID=279058 RepID=A0A0A1FJB1_9BURK|nr:GPW/gp25 family protein [Collimonas arenae]AIY42992.1 Phage baseplate assembly protein [Collimonas arenae]